MTRRRFEVFQRPPPGSRPLPYPSVTLQPSRVLCFDHREETRTDG